MSMWDHINRTQPKKFHRDLETPNFSKTQKLGHKMHENDEKREKEGI